MNISPSQPSKYINLGIIKQPEVANALQDMLRILDVMQQDITKVINVNAEVVSFSVHKNGSNQSIPNNTYTKVTFSTEEFDIGGYFDTTNSRFTPPAGYYSFNASGLLLASSDTHIIVLSLYKNGVSYKLGPYNRASGTGSIGAGINCLAAANGTDYFELYIFQDNGTQNLSGAATNSYFMGHRIGDL